MADMNPPVDNAEHTYESDRKIGKMNWDLEEINLVSAQIDLHLIQEAQCSSETVSPKACSKSYIYNRIFDTSVFNTPYRFNIVKRTGTADWFHVFR